MSQPNKDKLIKDLEDTVQKFFDKIQDIPFYIAINALTGHEVLSLDPSDDEQDRELLEDLKKAAYQAGISANRDGIYRPRPNEVGNDMEPYVLRALRELHLLADTPVTEAGKKKAIGYPDIYLEDRHGRPSYLEVKTYNLENIGTTQRSFYFSPAPDRSDLKITVDARHLVMTFQIETREQRRREERNCYVPVKWGIYSIYDMKVDVKHEFQSSNRELYREEALLAKGDIPEQV